MVLSVTGNKSSGVRVSGVLLGETEHCHIVRAGSSSDDRLSRDLNEESVMGLLRGQPPMQRGKRVICHM